MTLPSPVAPVAPIFSPVQDALFDAVNNQRLDEVRALLALPPEHRPDPLLADSHGNTALMLAVWANQEAMVAVLLPVSDPNQRNRYGRNALMLAAEQGKFQCAHRLLPHTDLSALDPKQENVLMIAVRSRDPDVMRMLLVSGLHDGPGALDPMGYNAAGKDLLVLSSVDGSSAVTRLIVDHVPALAQRLVATLPERGPLHDDSWLAWALCAHQDTLFEMLLPVSDPFHTDRRGQSAWSLARTDPNLPRHMLDLMAAQVPYVHAEALWNESSPEERAALPRLSVRHEQTELRRALDGMGDTVAPSDPKPRMPRQRL